ncbi:MAG: DSD1 family PLP-dependent enzyme, partial [Planctomycetaceae bacterium]|nr:DSD1 family PLP-dependent enzyme [Planctomycetaceae bacterium]
NAGRKAINPVLQMPLVVGVPGAEIESMSAEHTVLQLADAALDVKIGDHVALAVGYADHTLLMHRRIHVYRDGSKVDTWPVVRD